MAEKCVVCSKKIKLRVKTSVEDLSFVFPASHDLTIKELMRGLTGHIRELLSDPDGSFHKLGIRVGGTTNLKKGNYYLLPSDTVGDTLIDNDEVNCEIVEGSEKAIAKEDKAARKAQKKHQEAIKKAEKGDKPQKHKKSQESDSIEIQLDVPKEDTKSKPKPIAKKTASDVKLEEPDNEKKPAAKPAPAKPGSQFLLPKIDLGDMEDFVDSIIQQAPSDKKDKKKPAVMTARSDQEADPPKKKKPKSSKDE